MTFSDWLRVVAQFGGVFVATLAVGILVVWIASLFRRDDGYGWIGDAAPPPPHVSPFASPRTHGELTPAEGEVKP